MADQGNHWANVQTSQSQYASNQPFPSDKVQPDGLRAIHTRILKHCDSLADQTNKLRVILGAIVGNVPPSADMELTPDPPEHALFTASKIEAYMQSQLGQQGEIIAAIERALA